MKLENIDTSEDNSGEISREIIFIIDTIGYDNITFIAFILDFL